MSAAGLVALAPAATTLGRTLEKCGVVAAALLAALVVLAGPRPGWARWRALATLGALVLTPTLLVADIWDSPQLRPLRHHPALGVGAVLLGAVILTGLGLAMHGRRELVAVLAVAALPFRIPIASGGTTSNLLVPLYVIIAAAALADVIPHLRSRDAVDPDPPRAPSEPRAGALEALLVGLVVLYAVQASYSSDFDKALKQVVFFYVPFTLLFALLRRLAWTPQLLRRCLTVAVGLAVVFVAIGFVEYSRQQLLLNPKVLESNQVQSYFRVNSLFFDPNIYGRFLAMVMIALAAGLLWTVAGRRIAVIAGLLVLLWGGLLVSFSQSSITALLVGLAALAAVRWRPRWTLGATGLAVAVGVVIVLAAPRAVRFDVGSSQSANRATSGRVALIQRGIELFASRPLQGYGSASFVNEYRLRKHSSNQGAASASHTIPITVAAEQGILSLAVYVALLVAAFLRLFTAARGSAARSAIAAAFAALVLHTMLYADFLEDPVTWTLLGVGTALAWRTAHGRSTPAHGSAPSRPTPDLSAGGQGAAAAPA